MSFALSVEKACNVSMLNYLKCEFACVKDKGINMCICETGYKLSDDTRSCEGKYGNDLT